MTINKNDGQAAKSAGSNGANGNVKKNGTETSLTLPAVHRLVTEEKFPASPESQAANSSLEDLLREMLAALGEDPDRDGLKDTPQRVRRSLSFLTDGYTKNVYDVLGDAVFEETYD